MDTVQEKYKKLLRVCMEKKISLYTIQQVINLSLFPKAEKIADYLLEKIPTIKEDQLKKEIGKVIREQKN